MNLEETHGYIQHRLNVAGGKGKVAFSRSAADAVFRVSGGIPRLINRLADQALAEAHLQGVKKIDRRIIRDAEKERGALQPQLLNHGWLWKIIGGLMVVVGLTAIIIYFKTQFFWPDPVVQGNTLTQRIEQMPMDLSQPGRLVAQPPPKTRTLASTSNTAQQPATDQGAAGTESLSEGSEPAVSVATEAALLEVLATLTAGESKIEAARSVLKRWGAFRKETVTLNPRAREILKTDYGLSVYESNGNLNRLTTLNYPALVELELPDGRGSRYLALVGLKGNVGVFQSNTTLEIPLPLFDALWTHKAWVLWNNFEGLPGDMQTGYKGKYAEWLQIQLNRLGYYKEQPASRYGRRTADAVAKFQRYYNLKDHGRLDTETKMILYNRLPAYKVPRLTGN
ncbi:MAG: peptidoglycan-binding protein [Nitrospinae bacterium]|nr:peptidoglycan-binding protein [Nitrospinota bacterium]